MDHRRQIRIHRLKRTLERVAMISLIADIAISITTLASLWLGQAYTVGILFLINYILVIIVAISLVLIASIAILSHSHRFTRIFHYFRFRAKW